MSDLTPEKLAELRRKAENAKPFVRPGGTDPATVYVLASDVLALLDAAENQDILIGSVNHYKAERDALAAKLDTVRALAEHYAGLTNVDAGSAILDGIDR